MTPSPRIGPPALVAARFLSPPLSSLLPLLLAALVIASAPARANAPASTAVQGNTEAALAYEQAVREHMAFFQKHILKQGETATYMLEPVWGVVPPIGSIYDRANPADPDTSCVVPRALLPEELLIRDVPQFTDIKAASGALNIPLIGMALEKLKLFNVSGSYKQTLRYGLADTKQRTLSLPALERHFKTSEACQEALLGDETQAVLVVRGLITGREVFETDITTAGNAALGNEVVGGLSLKMDPSTKKATLTDTAEKPKFFILSLVKRGKRGSKMEDLFSAPTEEDLRRFRENLQRQR